MQVIELSNHSRGRIKALRLARENSDRLQFLDRIDNESKKREDACIGRLVGLIGRGHAKSQRARQGKQTQRKTRATSTDRMAA